MVRRVVVRVRACAVECGTGTVEGRGTSTHRVEKHHHRLDRGAPGAGGDSMISTGVTVGDEAAALNDDGANPRV